VNACKLDIKGQGEKYESNEKKGKNERMFHGKKRVRAGPKTLNNPTWKCPKGRKGKKGIPG